MNRKYTLNVAKLYHDLSIEKDKRGLAWREIARDCGNISPSIFVRLGKGKLIALTTLLRILAWANWKIEDYATMDESDYENPKRHPFHKTTTGEDR